MSKAKRTSIEVQGTTIAVLSHERQDYLCITDIAKLKNPDHSDDVIRNWLRSRNTVEFLGVWERLNNPLFNPVEFDGIRIHTGLNSFVLTPKQWIEKTGAVGLRSSAGRYGGTYAHKDIAFEFASWVSVEFKLYLIKEFQRLKDEENDRLQLGWNLQRTLAKINYRTVAGHGTGKLDTDELKAMELMLPRPAEQHRIATCLSSLDELIAAQSDRLSALQTHKQGLLQQLFPSPEVAADLKLDRSTLQRCVQFYHAFPNCATWRNLTWAHYRTLIPVGDEKARRALATQANRHEWTVIELEARTRGLTATAEVGVSPSETASPPKLLTAKRGTDGVHRVVARGEALAVDLGFKLYVGLDDAAFKAGGFATFDSRGRAVAAPDATKADLFTYAVTVRRVIDGDTLEVEIPLPHGYAHQLKLRLRALDCPEMDTPEGKAAKRFTESLVLPATSVEIVTSKPDKYDRYLADVFVPNGDGDYTFLNNELLRHGHAIRKDDWSATDWEK